MDAGPMPLAGIRVIDLSRVLAGPFATMLLGDLGADVIKVEPPGGDETRAWGPPWWGDPSDQCSAYFAAVNRNKRSIVLDLQTETGRALLWRLTAGADLLIHNYRPGTAARLGLEPADLAERFPELVVVAIGGFPGDGDRADRPAYDLLAQAESGLMAVTGEAGGPPLKTGVAVLDLLAGVEAALGALAALVGHGRVQRVEVRLMEAGVHSLVNVLGGVLAGGAEPGRHGSAHPNIVPYQAFPARDGDVVIAVGNDRQFTRLCGVLGVSDPDGRFATNPQRVSARTELVALLGMAIAGRDRDELLAALNAADVPAGPVRGVSEALAAMEEAQPGGWVEELAGIRTAPSPIRINGARLSIRRPPPRLGGDLAEVLAELEATGT